jgi:hypothetical protein
MSVRQSARGSPRDKEWQRAGKQHPLSRLQGKALNSYTLDVLLGAKNRFGASYFQVFLRSASGDLSLKPVVLGLFNQGQYPGYNWIEIITFTARVSFSAEGQSAQVVTDEIAQRLFHYLASLIPPGGHLMVGYDSPEQRDTARSLSLGIPPAATPLGYLMLLSGCGVGFKDWYFSEGGTEGPRKLQGYKALNEEGARLKNKELVGELREFLRRPSLADSELEKSARHRARAILSSMSH